MECKIYCWNARGEIYLNPVFIPTAMSQHLVFGSMGLVVPVRQLLVARLRHGNTAARAPNYLHVDTHDALGMQRRHRELLGLEEQAVGLRSDLIMQYNLRHYR